MMQFCQKCNDNDPITNELPCERVVHLCADCRVEWSRYFDGTDVAVKLIAGQSYLDALNICYSGHVALVDELTDLMLNGRAAHSTWILKIGQEFDKWLG